ncbi:uncharacterized protein EAF01_011278 [Botrytis porri]|uniref:uncharacterized protein n=1 Tax=Botrytis porri TaxID=87229 RepID=UPI0019023142|nr:uncharacterized protein EAF01_011278 [Botrytis porri]KAF7886600.1 hypothetical protein EAF01_011278 [Botrytis porri]
MLALPQYRGQSNPDKYLTKLSRNLISLLLCIIPNTKIGMQNELTHRKRPKNMSPSDVRQYLESLLVQNHQCDVKDANDIASYWVYGRGSEFYQYDLDTFKDMFGDEIGMLFFLYSRGLTPGGKLKGRFWRTLFICFAYFYALFFLWDFLKVLFRSLQ